MNWLKRAIRVWLGIDVPPTQTFVTFEVIGADGPEVIRIPTDPRTCGGR